MGRIAACLKACKYVKCVGPGAPVDHSIVLEVKMTQKAYPTHFMTYAVSEGT